MDYDMFSLLKNSHFKNNHYCVEKKGRELYRCN